MNALMPVRNPLRVEATASAKRRLKALCAARSQERRAIGGAAFQSSVQLPMLIEELAEYADRIIGFGSQAVFLGSPSGGITVLLSQLRVDREFVSDTDGRVNLTGGLEK